MKKITSVCPYCGAGCKLKLVVENNKIIRAEAAEVASICAQSAKLGVTLDAADAVRRGVSPDALRGQILDSLAAKSDASGILASTPAPTNKPSPLVTAARKSADSAAR